MPHKAPLFSNPTILEQFCEAIILPNMSLRPFEEELFEDDPLEYLRRDLEGTDSETRRQAAADFTQALMQQYEQQITGIITKYITSYLAQYAANPLGNWQSKDTAIYLLTSIASRSSSSQQGVTSTNALVDIVRFFSEHIVGDLQATANSVHPIIQADAIKFLYTFRSQLSKDQLLQVLPLLIPKLESDSFVIHTYAATTIERCLFIKRDGRFMCVLSNSASFTEDWLSVQVHARRHPRLCRAHPGRAPEEDRERLDAGEDRAKRPPDEMRNARHHHGQARPDCYLLDHPPTPRRHPDRGQQEPVQSEIQSLCLREHFGAHKVRRRSILLALLIGAV
jgi:hypothetical protein